MSTLHTPFRYDYVGSFLRPAQLKKARAGYEAGTVSAEELKAVEDDAITDLIAKQKAAGYHGLTDGEFRRQSWHRDFMWGFHGITHQKAAEGIPFHDEMAVIDDIFLTDKLYVDVHPFVEHFKFVKSFEDENTVARQTMPSPAQFLQDLTMPYSIGDTKKIYPKKEDLIEDIAEGYKKTILQLYDAGCRNIQFDDCTWGTLVDPTAKMVFDTDDAGLKAREELYLEINNLVLADKPDGLVINTHICRGNYHSTYASEGAYDAIAKSLFAKENVNAFYLEYDSARAGGFEPLALVPEGKKVVLGLITTKFPLLEKKDEVIARIYSAAQYVPLENLCLSPQCGFASCDIGNKLTEEEQWAKLKLVKEIAEEVWQ